MHRSRHFVAAVLSICGLVGYAAPPAAAQNLYVTANRTVAGGNPINGGVNGFVVVGANSGNTPFPGVVADITGGTITDYVAARNQSTVNISGGTIGQLSDGSVIYTGLEIRGGSTINLTGGTIQSFVTVGPMFGDDGTVNTFNMSGGTVPYIFNNGGGVVNITGGSIASAPGFVQGVVANYGNGTVTVTGGTMNLISGLDSAGGGGTINFGGTASTDRLYVTTGTANITGGTIGAGGVQVQGTGVANFTGSGLTINNTGTHGFFDPNFYQNFITADYSITGTLAGGTAINTTITAGADFTNDGASATFNAAALAPDLYVTTDQTVSSIYNNVYVGIDETFSNPADPTVTLADGFDTVELQTQSASATTMTGGVVHDFAFVTENSQLTVTGGEIQGAAVALDNATITVSGGTIGFLEGDGNATLSVSGGNIGGYYLSGTSTLTFQGTGLSATGTTAPFWDGSTNYIAAGNFAVTGTLADGTTLDQTILAGGASGTGSQQTLIAPQAAPNLFLTENATTDGLYNQVTVGANADGSVNTSPTVTVGAGSDIGGINVRNQSTLNVQDGVIRGLSFVSKDTSVNISGGRLEGRLFQDPNAGSGNITVSGGVTNYIAPRNLITVTGGQVGTLDTYAGARVRVEGGDINSMLLFGGPSNVTDVVIRGGNVGTIDYRTQGNILTILGGTVNAIRISTNNVANLYGGNIGSIIGLGGTINLLGGTIGPDTLAFLGANATIFTLYGSDFLLNNPTAGTYTDPFGTSNSGVYWDLTGTLRDGTTLSTHYFEKGGSLAGATGIQFLAGTAAAPEPGTFVLVATILAGVGFVRRRRSATAVGS